MSPNSNLIGNFVQKYESELIQAWLGKLNHEERDLLRRLTGDSEKTLRILLNEILGLIDESVSQLTFADEAAHFSAPKYEVNTILAGEEAFVEVLKKRLQVSPRTWNSLRRELSQAFHEALRTNSAATCDCCRWILNQKPSLTTGISHSIESDQQRKRVLAAPLNELAKVDLLGGVTGG